MSWRYTEVTLMSECSVLVEQYSTASVMSHVKMTRQELVLEVLDCHLQSNDMQFPPRFSMAPCFPRRIPGFQLKMLRLLFSCNRQGTSLIKRYSGLGEECLLSCASRKIGLALLKLTRWRSRVEAGSTFTQAVYPSRMDETSSS